MSLQYSRACHFWHNLAFAKSCSTPARPFYDGSFMLKILIIFIKVKISKCHRYTLTFLVRTRKSYVPLKKFTVRLLVTVFYVAVFSHLTICDLCCFGSYLKLFTTNEMCVHFNSTSFTNQSICYVASLTLSFLKQIYEM